MISLLVSYRSVLPSSSSPLHQHHFFVYPIEWQWFWSFQPSSYACDFCYFVSESKLSISSTLAVSLLYSLQYGSFEVRSTGDILHCVTRIYSSSFRDAGEPFVVSLDILKPFHVPNNTLENGVLLTRAHARLCPGESLHTHKPFHRVWHQSWFNIRLRPLLLAL